MNDSDNRKARCCSSTWRGFSVGAKLLSEGINWRVGDGCRIGFWIDKWIPDLGKLQWHASLTLTNIQINEKVSEYMDMNEWNLQKLSSVLPWYVVHRIFNIHIGSNHDVVDSIIWGHSKNGDFSVSSAYGIQLSGTDFDSWK